MIDKVDMIYTYTACYKKIEYETWLKCELETWRLYHKPIYLYINLYVFRKLIVAEIYVYLSKYLNV